MLIPVIFSAPDPAYGYIAGEAPDGLVKQEGTPVSALLDLFDTKTRAWLRSTYSAPDGTYVFPALPVAGNYFVVARPPNPAFVYEVQENITPEAY